MLRFSALAVFCLAATLWGCRFNPPAPPETPARAENAREAEYRQVTFAELPGWGREDFAQALTALEKSCAVFLKRDASAAVNPRELAGTVAEWQPACRALAMKDSDPRTFFEHWFTPYAVTTPFGDDGLFTGYYEKKLRGSRTPGPRYSVPIYKRPPELVMVELGDFRPALKGERIAGKIMDGKLKPFADRRAIEGGALANRNLELAWAEDENAVFFLQVQGSGRLQLEDGTEMRIGYDGQNGHPYVAIGRELIARGELTRENVSLETIHAWLLSHPDQAAALRAVNPSYVFFKEIDGAGPLGAQGIALTSQRSLAVDPRFIPYGAPVFLDIAHPTQDKARLQRLVIAQDTGGAITGPVRGDYFWGAGSWDDANVKAAGAMKSRGRAYVLLPKTLGQNPRRVNLVEKK